MLDVLPLARSIAEPPDTSKAPTIEPCGRRKYIGTRRAGMSSSGIWHSPSVGDETAKFVEVNPSKSHRYCSAASKPKPDTVKLRPPFAELRVGEIAKTPSVTCHWFADAPMSGTGDPLSSSAALASETALKVHAGSRQLRLVTLTNVAVDVMLYAPPL
eukprot:1975377-Rhodomonas_salina.2